MNVEIVAVGTELLLGQILNTNGQYLSTRLATIGANVYFQTVVGDNEGRLNHAIEVAKKRADVLIFTGGLGPTEDDLTKEVVAKHFGKNLIYHDETLNSIQSYYLKVGREMTENNKKQAFILEDAHPLLNHHGMAVGSISEFESCMVILLPGPPSEMKPMFQRYAEPYLVRKLNKEEVIHSKMLRFYGIGESTLETMVQDLMNSTNPTIAPLASDGEVALRLTAKARTLTQAEAFINKLEHEVNARVGKYVYGHDEDTLSTVLIKKLKERKWTISFAESLSGGLASSMITEIPGSSEVLNGSLVSYSNEVKEKILGVQFKTLQDEGAVSAQCAYEMAQGCKNMFHSQVGISLTGVAGPSTSEDKDVGTVFVGIAIDGKDTDVLSLKLAGTREQIRLRAVKTALWTLIKKLSE